MGARWRHIRSYQWKGPPNGRSPLGAGGAAGRRHGRWDLCLGLQPILIAALCLAGPLLKSSLWSWRRQRAGNEGHCHLHPARLWSVLLWRRLCFTKTYSENQKRQMQVQINWISHQEADWPLGTLPDLSITSLALSWTDTIISNVATCSLLIGFCTKTAPGSAPTDRLSLKRKTFIYDRLSIICQRCLTSV